MSHRGALKSSSRPIPRLSLILLSAPNAKAPQMYCIRSKANAATTKMAGQYRAWGIVGPDGLSCLKSQTSATPARASVRLISLARPLRSRYASPHSASVTSSPEGEVWIYPCTCWYVGLCYRFRSHLAVWGQRAAGLAVSASVPQVESSISCLHKLIGSLARPNAPAKLRRACATAIPPPTSRAPSASAGC